MPARETPMRRADHGINYMLTQSQLELIDATVPVLREHGVALTSHFYKRMLSGNPELKNIFNQAHQHKGEQQAALAGAVLAYAENIRNPERLAGAVRHIALKHTTIGIRSEHYAIVGRHLLASMKEVLGDACTPELLDAWGAAYNQLADILIEAEQKIYDEQTHSDGGWSGWRPMKVANRVQECRDVASFYLEPVDGGPLPEYEPGQFISVRTFVKSAGLMQPRQYSLSQISGSPYLRITVKRITDEEAGLPEGAVSNEIYNNLKIGDVIEASFPSGDFTIDVEADHPIVFIAAGIGITPMVSMLQTLATKNPLRRVHFIYTTRNGECFPLRKDVETALKGLPNSAKAVFFTRPLESDALGSDYDAVGRPTPENLRAFCQHPDADFYLCGPIPFMKDVAKGLRSVGVIAPRIHGEAFGTGSWQ